MMEIWVPETWFFFRSFWIPKIPISGIIWSVTIVWMRLLSKLVRKRERVAFVVCWWLPLKYMVSRLDTETSQVVKKLVKSIRWMWCVGWRILKVVVHYDVGRIFLHFQNNSSIFGGPSWALGLLRQWISVCSPPACPVTSPA